MGRARAQAEADMLRIIAEGYAQAVAAGDPILGNMMAFCLVEAMERMLPRPAEAKSATRAALPSPGKEKSTG
jgi:hypothetical protein